MRSILFLMVVLRDVTQGRDEVALEVLEFIKSHQGLLDRIMRDDSPGVHLADLDELQLATAILSKVITSLSGQVQQVLILSTPYISTESVSCILLSGSGILASQRVNRCKFYF